MRPLDDHLWWIDVITRPIGVCDKYNRGKVVHIDSTYRDWVIIWVQYKRYCKAYLAWGN